MDKPITLVREEFKQSLVNVINNSGLPAFVIEPILNECLKEVRIVMQKQYESDKSKYEQFLKSEKK